MKPLYLEMQAFGPYVKKQCVDFEKLSENGIFLIMGDTGSGKTTIFDAITFALFGGCSGKDDNNRIRRNDFEQWRCTQAPDELDTLVSFTFAVKGVKYRFTRKLELARIKRNQKLEAGTLLEDGTLVPFFENPTETRVNEKAAELVGLTKDQFRQVVLLPQGQFERFLDANSKEKEDILKKIFETEQWTDYAGALFDRVNARNEELKKLYNEILLLLSNEKVGTMEELAAKIAEFEQKKKACEEEEQAFDAQKKRDALSKDIALAERFAQLHALEKQQAALLAGQSEFAAKEAALDIAERAEALRKPLADAEKAQKESDTRARAYEQLVAGLPAAQKAKTDAEKAAEDWKKQSPVAGLTQSIGAYEGKKSLYLSIDALMAAYEKAKRDWTAAKTAHQTAATALAKQTAAAGDAKKAFDEADRTAKDCRDKYFSGIYGELASALTENAPCPVCGSTVHPAPAPKTPDSVSKQEVERTEQAAQAARKRWATAEENRTAAETAEKARKTTLDEAQTAYTKAETDWEAAGKNLLDGIPDSTALQAAIDGAKRKIEEYNQREAQLGKLLEQKTQALTALNEQIRGAAAEKEAAAQALNTAREALRQLLSGSGFATEDEARRALLNPEKQKALANEITEYRTRRAETARTLAAKKAEMEGRTEPNAADFRARQNEIDRKSAEFNRNQALYKNEVTRLTKLCRELEAKKGRYDKEFLEASNDLKFAKQLRGDSGISLQRYVLAIMFNQVIGEANRMLEKVHNGRYQLFRTDEKGNGNQSGLEMKVHDSRKPKDGDRSIDSLSGGEKFLVSLALSIGMSTVCQKSGIRIEALFIDEGFGTLDTKSIKDAMQVLRDVREGCGTIGIISHLPLLEENISTHLEVLKSENGSTIQMG